jgi:hypothetical protein
MTLALRAPGAVLCRVWERAAYVDRSREAVVAAHT